MCHLGVVEFSESSYVRYDININVGMCCSSWDGGLPQCVQMGETFFFSAAEIQSGILMTNYQIQIPVGSDQYGYTQVRQVGQNYQVVVDSMRRCGLSTRP